MELWPHMAAAKTLAQNELPRSKLTRYQKIAMRIYLKGVTPECFHRGSVTVSSKGNKGRAKGL